MLNPRLQIILRELMATKTPITGEYLANKNHVTGRTIRSDVKELNAILAKNGASILSLSGKGYMLEVANENQFRTFLQTLATERNMKSPVVPESQAGRAVFLVNRLLLAEDYVKLDELADELYVSKSTVENDLKQVKTNLSEYGIHLEKRPNYGLRAVGGEVKIRFCLAEYLFDDQRDKAALVSPFTSLDSTVMSRISAIIMEQIECHQIVLSDIAVNNLVIHIAIAYKRIKSGYHVSLPNKDLKLIEGEKEYQVAKAIVKKVEATFNIGFPQTEVAYIAIHLLGTKLLTKANSGNVMHMMDESISRLVELVLDQMEAELNLGIKDDRELTIALSLHLKPAINRYHYGMNVRNPMLQDIKTNYPLAFEAGVIAGLAINYETGIEINENEVGYLALHIGAAIERRKLTCGPKRCLIICASGFGTAQLIYYRLKNYFGKSLEVAGTTEYYQLSSEKLNDIDFIISSIPIEQELAVQVVEVNAILGESDLRRIEKVVADEQESPNHYFHEELLFLRQSFDSKEEVLQFFQRVLQEKDLVDNTLLVAIYEREELAPTSYGNMVAIPHPIRPKSEETFLAVCTLEKPIDWNGNPVQFICLLSVKKESQEDLQSMYELLGNIVDSPEVVQDLVKARTFREFLDVLR